MKKTLRDTGATEKTKIDDSKTDYFQIARTSDPIKSYGLKEFRNTIEAERKKKTQKPEDDT
jgi:hypothetical protein